MSDVDVLAISSIVMADEQRIRADERRKFAEWFAKVSKVSQLNFEYTIKRWIEDYEKDQKGETE